MAKQHVVTGDQYLSIGRKLTEINRQLFQNGGYPFDLDRLSTALQAIIEGRFGPAAVYRVTVEARQTLEERILAGNFSKVDPEISAGCFSTEDRAEPRVIETELAHFGEVLDTQEILDELDKRGLRAATLEEGLAFAHEYPAIQRHLPIVCLGSVWTKPVCNYRHFPCLHGSPTFRNLYLTWVDPVDRWLGYYWRFLAVRK